MPTPLLRNFLVCLVVTCSVANSHGLEISEPFNYTAGLALSGLNGGTNWGGAWTGSGTSTIQSPSLDFPGSSETGNKAVLGYNGSTYTNFRLLNSVIDENAFSSVSFSFLFNLTGNDAETGIRFAGLSFFNGGTEQIFFGKPGNTTEVGYEKYAGGTDVAGVDVSFNSSTVFRFVANITFNPTGDDLMTIVLTDNSGSVNQTWSNLNLGGSFAFDRIRLIRDFALDSGINPEFDEISFTAVPEPATWSLLAGAGAACLFLRRRRRG